MIFRVFEQDRKVIIKIFSSLFRFRSTFVQLLVSLEYPDTPSLLSKCRSNWNRLSKPPELYFTKVNPLPSFKVISLSLVSNDAQRSSFIYLCTHYTLYICGSPGQSGSILSPAINIPPPSTSLSSYDTFSNILLECGGLLWFPWHDLNITHVLLEPITTLIINSWELLWPTLIILYMNSLYLNNTIAITNLQSN
jgi:hypothetical protein